MKVTKRRQPSMRRRALTAEADIGISEKAREDLLEFIEESVEFIYAVYNGLHNSTEYLLEPGGADAIADLRSHVFVSKEEGSKFDPVMAMEMLDATLRYSDVLQDDLKDVEKHIKGLRKMLQKVEKKYGDEI